MTLIECSIKILIKLRFICFFSLFQYPRIIKYNILSTCATVTGKPKKFQPVLLAGKGEIVFGEKVKLGVPQSPFYYSGYIYIDSRQSCSKIQIGNNVFINNSCVLISEGEGIVIGDFTIMGTNCEIIDSDFHDLDPVKRIGGQQKTEKVSLGKNVFLGSNVRIMKGVSIGDNSVIANSAVVTRSIPSNVIAAGNPAKVTRYL